MADNEKDIFNKKKIQTDTPITADYCEIWFDGEVVATALGFTLEYNQGVTRRRSIGSKTAVIYGGQPNGRASMQRMITVGSNFFGGKTGENSWSCEGGTLEFHLGSCNGTEEGRVFHAQGCMVSSFSLQVSSEDLTVADAVTIDFLELTEG